ncbi:MULTISPECIES: DUF5336 domain-containing protein [Streptomyces]|uniref:Integral membrane protein n=1 Tax=Streptomyces spororaveus TaxID=284039 RepID=A0ABQ3TIY4_9ACTN|nr:MULTISPECIES: DUF5336 domain-containing protein [Streptomyces]MCM9079302.1 DUF5336 domain-containing protein [Streptomyces spororaveus]MCX5306272.1 DUF5336 domain-containing protein [Streptomyces sp. NBC_00160]GHI80369.1 hypothetical protein Sspor_59300 [Streptomyces spororaveus]
MNIRSLTRGDGVVIGAAALLFIASFLDFYSATGVDRPSPWDLSSNHLTLPSIFLLGFIAAGLLIAARFQPERKLAGLPLTAWGTVLAVSAAWSSVWALIACPEIFDLGAGSFLALIATLALAGVAVAGAKVPALAGQLVPEPRPAAVPPYGGQPGQPQPGAGYGYPGGQQTPYGATPQPVPPYGGTPNPTPGPGPQDSQQTPTPAPAADFSPFWFAVPVARPLYAEDGSPSPIAELAPGTWYLAVEQRGAATLIAQTQDGRRGVLNDTSGIQRG